MKIIISVAALLFCIQIVLAKDVYQQVRVYYTLPQQLTTIAETGIPMDHIRHKRGVYVELTASEVEVARLESQGFEVEVLEPNLLEFYRSRFDRRFRTYEDFKLGSMGGNYTLAEMEAELDTLHFLYPNLVSEKMSIGKSVEGRNIWTVKVSDNVDLDENSNEELESRILYTGLTHAREPLGMMNLIYFIHHLCKNYGIEKLPTDILNNRELWFVPCVNPDGYVYNQTIAPEGGGMHRKNRKDTNCGEGTTRGVDLNRNFSYRWGTDNEGSSPDPCSPSYRGSEAFSEPESSVLRDFMASMRFRNVLHYHSYSNLLIHPYGDGSYPPEPDLSMFRAFGREMTMFNQYHVGTGIETVGYTVNGDAVDYSYVREQMVAFTPEVGDWEDGFWPSSNRIGPLCQENLWPNSYFAKMAGTVMQANLIGIDGVYFQSGETTSRKVSFRNAGLRKSLGNVTATVNPLDSAVRIDAISINLGLVERRQFLADTSTVPISVTADVPRGCSSGLVFHFIDDNREVQIDTIGFVIGAPDISFNEDGESDMNQWRQSSWGFSNEAYSGSASITDSPDGNYSANSVKSLVIDSPIDLTNVSNSRLVFWAKWDIEDDYDGVSIEVQANGGPWISLPGKYTKKSSGSGSGQPKGSFVYDGKQTDWVKESIDLDAIEGFGEVLIRFVFRSDEYTEEDGFYFDDLQLLTYPALDVASGDLTGDCLIDVADLLKLVDLVMWPSSASDNERSRADMNHDSLLNVLDIVKLVDKVLGS